MILLLHISIALISILSTAYAWFRPSQLRLYVSYACVAGTIGSGSYLIFTKPVHMMSTCITGLVYIAVVFVGIALARQRLHAIKTA